MTWLRLEAVAVPVVRTALDESRSSRFSAAAVRDLSANVAEFDAPSVNLYQSSEALSLASTAAREAAPVSELKAPSIDWAAAKVVLIAPLCSSVCTAALRIA